MKNWYCYSDNLVADGPYPENSLKELINWGQLTADTFVFNDSPEEAPKGWQRARDTEIAVLLLNNSQGNQSIPSRSAFAESEKPRVEAGRHRKLEETDVKSLGKDFWISSLMTLAQLAFLVIVIGGTVIGCNLFGENGFVVIIGFIISFVIALLAVGFVIVFLNLATDIRIIRRYLTERND